MPAAENLFCLSAGGLQRRLFVLLFLMLMGLISPASAHDPFDGGTQMLVFDHKIEVNVILGTDAAREFLVSLGLPSGETFKLQQPAQPGQLMDLPSALASRLVDVRAGGESLVAARFAVVPSESELSLFIEYPRPATQTLTVRVSYFDAIEFIREGTFVAALGSNRRILASALVSKARLTATVPLTLEAGPASVVARTSWADYFILGFKHILGGFDHLLFLCALLAGVYRIRPMLAIITAFTLAHSVTLALAALNLVVLSSRLVEPMIALSIIVVCLENFWRREATADRYWMSAAFGLIHGFGFAELLRERAMAEPGGAMVMPLLGFNLGVEAGQLMVAAVVVPALLLLRRHHAGFNRCTTPVVSGIVMLISTFWLLQRTHLI